MRRFPDWLKKSIPEATTLQTDTTLNRFKLNTICYSAKCPNRSECFAARTATFLILGNLCTRRCTFCSVPQGNPSELDMTEPDRVAKASLDMGLNHVVVTSVNRDDLEDGGAEIFFQHVLDGDTTRQAGQRAGIQIHFLEFSEPFPHVQKGL